MSRRLFLVLAATGCAAGLQAQVLQPLQGLRELPALQQDAQQDWVVVVRNTGAVPVRVSRVEAECGLSLRDSARVIQPGQRGRFVLRVLAEGRQGTFEKQVRVYGSDGGAPAVSRIRYQVQAGTDLRRMSFRDTVGVLARETQAEAVGAVTEGRARSVTVRVKNISRQSVRFLDTARTTQAFRWEPSVEVLAPDSVATIRFSYLPYRLAYLDTSYGLELPFRVPVHVFTDEGPNLRRKTFHFAGTYVPAPSTQAAQPVFQRSELNAGRVKPGTRHVLRFRFANHSNSTLHLHACQGLGRELRLVSATRNVAPGAEGSIVLQFAPQPRSGRVHRSVTLRGNFTPVVLHVQAQVQP